MPVDNQIYDAMAETWWDESGFLHILRALNPARFGYMRRILLEDPTIDVRGRRVLDVGCGGGLLAEEFARLGCDVNGIDPSAKSVQVAREHAGMSGLTIRYCRAAGESIPFHDHAFDIVYCCDVLEHVENPEQVIGEISRVLSPGGLFFYDTINRTFLSKLVVISLFQEWPWTSLMPPGLHDWDHFIKPEELREITEKHGLRTFHQVGLSPTAGAIAIVRLLLSRKRGEISYTETARRIGLRETGNTSISYIGSARKVS